MELYNTAIFSLLSLLISSFLVVIVTVIIYLLLSRKKLLSPTEGKNNIDLLDIQNFLKSNDASSDGVLPVASAFMGVCKLEVYADEFQPEFIVGINRGGWLVSTYLAHRLKISRSNLLRFDSEKKVITDSDVSIHNKNIHKILLIDDISRTGTSIQDSLIFFKKSYPRSILRTAVIVACADNELVGKEIDFCPYKTKFPDIQLPWSPEDRKKDARERLKKSGLSNIVYDLEKEEKNNPDISTGDLAILRIAGVDILKVDADEIKTALKSRIAS